ncbi:Hypothetical protein FKW44_006607, partial [Caligus rogercresseyi]
TWPSNSPDLTLVTTTVGEVGGGGLCDQPQLCGGLKSSITSVAMSLEAAEVSRSVRAFRSRVETVVEAGGRTYE